MTYDLLQEIFIDNKLDAISIAAPRAWGRGRRSGWWWSQRWWGASGDIVRRYWHQLLNPFSNPKWTGVSLTRGHLITCQIPRCSQFTVCPYILPGDNGGNWREVVCQTTSTFPSFPNWLHDRFHDPASASLCRWQETQVWQASQAAEMERQKSRVLLINHNKPFTAWLSSPQTSFCLIYMLRNIYILDHSIDT